MSTLVSVLAKASGPVAALATYLDGICAIERDYRDEG